MCPVHNIDIRFCTEPQLVVQWGRWAGCGFYFFLFAKVVAWQCLSTTPLCSYRSLMTISSRKMNPHCQWSEPTVVKDTQSSLLLKRDLQLVANICRSVAGWLKPLHHHHMVFVESCLKSSSSQHLTFSTTSSRGSEMLASGQDWDACGVEWEQGIPSWWTLAKGKGARQGCHVLSVSEHLYGNLNE
jgi:hypothetical protein